MDWQPKPPDFRVTVWDSGSALPQPVRAEADDEGGRGLALVESCSDDWGVVDYTDKDAGVGQGGVVRPRAAEGGGVARLSAGRRP
ncbi:MULTISPECIES: ATP-binding protein [unclassified Streptomyces]|uniref:ATP-binding protein n=1 Tax=unclassified Streptomyces TaxID=2593676 RepID=UPI003369CA77